MRFVEEYVKDQNATQAAIRAGFSAKCAHSTGDKLLKIGGIQLAIAEKLEIVRVKMQAEIVRQEEENWLDPVNIAKGFRDIYKRCMQAEPVMRYDRETKTMVPVRDEEGNAVYVFDSAGANRAWENIAKHVGFYDLDNKQKAPVINIGVTNNIALINGGNNQETPGDYDQLGDGNILTVLPPSPEE